MPRIKVVSIDLDNTLWDVDRIILNAEKEMRGWLNEHVPSSTALYTPERLDVYRQRIIEAHEDKRHDLSFMRIAVLGELIRESGFAEVEARTLAEQAFDVFFHWRNQVEFFPGAEDMLTHLAERYPVFALTNGNADVARAGLSAYLSGAVSSADVGVSKPDKAMFNAVLERAGASAAQALHIGDHLHDDIYGANQAGMASLWVNLDARQQRTADDSAPTREVESLHDVPEAVAAIEATL